MASTDRNDTVWSFCASVVLMGACQGLVGKDLTHSHIYLTTAFDPIETTHEAHTSPTVDPLHSLAEPAFLPPANPQLHEPISGPNFS